MIIVFDTDRLFPLFVAAAAFISLLVCFVVVVVVVDTRTTLAYLSLSS